MIGLAKAGARKARIEARRSPGARAGALASTVAVALGLLAGCGGGSGGAPAPVVDPSCDGPAFASTWQGIQETVLARNGCTEKLCHGGANAGGLDLSPATAYANLFDVPSAESPSTKRVLPGDKDRSWLWMKLAAKTRPGTVSIVGSPMPSNLPAISERELDLLRQWIYAGAPETGTVPGTEDLLGGCLPPVEPISIKPLDPPAPGEGVQFVLPPIEVPPGTEQEYCFATYYDVSDQVPPSMLDPSGRLFRYSEQELRQDPLSHHLVLLDSGLPAEKIHDPAFGAWTCAGGERAGETCEPTDLASCGTGGFCRSEPKVKVGCVGFGPRGSGYAIVTRQMGGAQATNAFQRLHPGVFAQIPTRGIAYWNTHAFNLSDQAHELNGRINFRFATDQRFPLQSFFDPSHVFAANAAPFTTQTVCAKYVMPRGSRLFGLTSHNHKRGKRFWAKLPDGTQIFENTVYNDPNKARFEPPLEFDSPDPAERSIEYCGLYNNGVGEDGSPDPETVTRASRMPSSDRLEIMNGCKPVACAAGRVGAACAGLGDDRACDSAPGANDGWCDACAITGGESTENEMFILIGQSFVDERFPQPPDDQPAYGGLASIP
ncbi:hypothetical protein KGQ64_11570 [bacterium]|nr:hypothetical protein [bacterium]